jgi:iron complex transport system substrate-binding protein
MSPVATVLVYTLAPDLLAGWNYQPVANELRFLAEPYRTLPVVGGWFGKSTTGNIEEILRSHPDVMLSIGDMNDSTNRSTALRVQEQTGLPVFLGDSGLHSLEGTYAAIGDLLGQKDRAAELGAYCRKTIDEIESKVKTIPMDRRRRLYYAEGPKGQETDPRGSPHSESLDFAGALNVAEVPAEHGYGNTPVSMEQVLRWNPDIVIAGYDHNTSPGEFYRKVWSDPVWRNVKAVQKHEVYETPQYPFNWIDRPPSANRILGIRWLANLFYPDVFRYDIPADTKEFYWKFYHRKLTDAEVAELLAQAVRKPQTR